MAEPFLYDFHRLTVSNEETRVVVTQRMEARITSELVCGGAADGLRTN
jgi:hypothetical protein